MIKKTHSKKFFQNNKIIFVFSLAVSFILWLVIALTNSEKLKAIISDIPINVELSTSATADGLKVFSNQDIKARVEISGNKFIVPKITKNDIEIIAQQAPTLITSPGNYTLELTARKASYLTDYEFTSDVRPNFITVVVDRYREIELNLESKIEFSASNGLFIGNTVLSSNTVKISGPENEIAKIKRAEVQKNFSNTLSSTVNFDAPIVLYDNYDKQIFNEKINMSLNQVNVTIPILVKKEIKIIPTFVNKPEKLVLKENILKISPKTLEIAGPKEAFENFNEITLPKINFQKLSINKNKFELPINLSNGCKSLNNVYSVKVEFVMESFREKQIRATNFSFINIPEKKIPTAFNGSVNVRIIGPANKINAIKPSDITIQIDLKGKEKFKGSMEIPAKIIINNYYEFWTLGEYFVNIKLV